MAPDRPALLNLALCDGERTVVTRYSSGHMPANRLYFGTGRMYVRDQGFCRMGDEGDGWTRVEPYHLALVTPELSVSTGPIEVG